MYCVVNEREKKNRMRETLWRWWWSQAEHQRKTIYQRHAQCNCSAATRGRQVDFARWNLSDCEQRAKRAHMIATLDPIWSIFFMESFTLCTAIGRWISIVCVLCKHWSIVESHAIRKYELLIRQRRRVSRASNSVLALEPAADSVVVVESIGFIAFRIKQQFNMIMVCTRSLAANAFYWINCDNMRYSYLHTIELTVIELFKWLFILVQLPSKWMRTEEPQQHQKHIRTFQENKIELYFLFQRCV